MRQRGGLCRSGRRVSIGRTYKNQRNGERRSIRAGVGSEEGKGTSHGKSPVSERRGPIVKSVPLLESVGATYGKPTRPEASRGEGADSGGGLAPAFGIRK